MTQTIIYYLYIQSFHNEGLSWQWSYGSWIYHFLFSQCLSPLILWVRLPLRARCTTLCDKDCQWLAAGQWVFSGSSGFIHLQNWPPRYNWNIVESDIKHHKSFMMTVYLLLKYSMCYFLVIRIEGFGS
jgi:hypothetical protein